MQNNCPRWLVSEAQSLQMADSEATKHLFFILKQLQLPQYAYDDSVLLTPPVNPPIWRTRDVYILMLFCSNISSE